MADATFAFTITQDEATIPSSFELETGVNIVAAAAEAVVKTQTLATNLYLVDTAEVDATVLTLGTTGLSVVNHGGLTAAQIAQACYAHAAAYGLIRRETAYGLRTVLTAPPGADGDLLTAELEATALDSGTWTPAE